MKRNATSQPDEALRRAQMADTARHHTTRT
jgi:hypothetical protein